MLEILEKFKKEKELKEKKLIKIIEQKEEQLKNLNGKLESEKNKLIENALSTNLEGNEEENIKESVKNLESKTNSLKLDLEIDIDINKKALERLKNEKLVLTDEILTRLQEIKKENDIEESFEIVAKHVEDMKYECKVIETKISRLDEMRAGLKNNIGLLDDELIKEVNGLLQDVSLKGISIISDRVKELEFNASKELFWQRQFLADTRRPLIDKRGR